MFLLFAIKSKSNPTDANKSNNQFQSLNYLRVGHRYSLSPALTWAGHDQSDHRQNSDCCESFLDDRTKLGGDRFGFQRLTSPMNL